LLSKFGRDGACQLQQSSLCQPTCLPLGPRSHCPHLQGAHLSCLFFFFPYSIALVVEAFVFFWDKNASPLSPFPTCSGAAYFGDGGLRGPSWFPERCVLGTRITPPFCPSAILPIASHRFLERSVMTEAFYSSDPTHLSPEWKFAPHCPPPYSPPRLAFDTKSPLWPHNIVSRSPLFCRIFASVL